MANSSTYPIAKAQANLAKLVKEDSFAISRHGEIQGFFLSKARIEALVETMELLADDDFRKALKELKSGRMKTYSVEELEPATNA